MSPTVLFEDTVRVGNHSVKEILILFLAVQPWLLQQRFVHGCHILVW